MENPSLNAARAWLAELDQSVADGDQPPDVIQLFEEYTKCKTIPA